MQNKVYISEGRFLDLAIIYMLAKKMILPFKKWRAYELGIIDERGKRIKKYLKTTEEQNAYTLLDRVIRRTRVFIGDRWFMKLSLAYLLMKESEHDTDNQALSLLMEEDLKNTWDIDESIDIAPNERITFKYTDNNSTFDFFILSELKLSDKEEYLITSVFGSKDIPKAPNEKFLDKMNNMFYNIMSGGHEEFIVYGSNSENIRVVSNYSSTEIKIETAGTGSLILGKFYVAISSKDTAMEVIDLWTKIFKGIKNG